MTSLVNQQIASTFGDLLTCTNGGQGLSNAQTNLQDGLGNNSPILIATDSVNFDRGLGEFQLDGVSVTAQSVDINSMCLPNPIALGNAYFWLPRGTTAQRPGGPQAGYFRYNNETTNLEYYNGTTWNSLSAGGTVTSVSGTAGQITVANPTTTPVISLPTAITGINSITSSSTLSLVSTVGAAASVSIGAGVISNICTIFRIRSGGALALNNSDNSFSATFTSSILNENTAYFLPTNKPTQDDMAMTCEVSGQMNWKAVQLMKTFNITGSDTLEANSKNIINSAGPVTLLLPSTCAVGSIIKVVGNTELWTITQNSGQVIHWLNQNTTVGVGGSLAANSAHNCVELVCVVADTEFTVASHEGSLVVT